jgi:hypothetical protein
MSPDTGLLLSHSRPVDPGAARASGGAAGAADTGVSYLATWSGSSLSPVSTVPRISEFFGIVIAMYDNDHAPAPFHWPNGADIDPDVLYEGRTPAAWEASRVGSRHA